ncbi:MAG: carbohydrate binding family 9 domain-containing protein [Candidatus Aminicenantes bacterium]|nr:MAG: carbohydrate binding family 9 domain-containing protein [Candidatus Aminicenantes bacterium]
MKKTTLFIVLLVELLIVSCMYSPSSMIWANSQQGSPRKQTIYPQRCQTKPKIDGILDEEAWQNPPLEKEFISYSRIYGEILPYKTLIWPSYDDENLYFAFLCCDPEPQKIKTSVTKRDNMVDDDWVGLSLDSLATKQNAYAFFVNPSGIQGDGINSAVSGTDLSPDFVWECAGKITEKGYQVEICIPLRSISFKSAKKVRMEILFWRRISRLSMNGSWPEPKAGYKVFNIHTSIIYKDLKKPLKFELLPDITYVNNRQRINPEEFGEKDIQTGFGIGLKYGITSSITADITINPDFSQVESDALQVEVNQRYPLFYTEKRPFFMEGSNMFAFFTMPYGFFPQAVHTRRIVDPTWGAKLTGTVGKTDFGILTAGDEWPGLAWESGTNPYEGKQAFFSIVRGRYSLGKDNYVGLLYSGRELSDQYNRVFGADLGYRLLQDHRINISFLHSISTPDNPGASSDHNVSGSYFNFMYSHITKPLVLQAAFEHIGRDFKMESAFLKRTGFNEGFLYAWVNFHPKLTWLKRIGPKIQFFHLHDLNTDINDRHLVLGLEFNFIKEGFLEIDYFFIKENWMGQIFDLNQFYFSGMVQFFKWLRISSSLTWGEKIFYEAEPSYKGKGYDGWFSLVFQPNKNLNQEFRFSHSDLSRDQEKIYDVNILYSRTTYQFNRYFFLRGIFQYNSFEKRLLTDFLASFTLIPGTVLHVGYGALYENREWRDNNWLYRQGDMLNIKRSIFLKVSYLWRLGTRTR